jgi:hypothetical protein
MTGTGLPPQGEDFVADLRRGLSVKLNIYNGEGYRLRTTGVGAFAISGLAVSFALITAKRFKVGNI